MIVSRAAVYFRFAGTLCYHDLQMEPFCVKMNIIKGIGRLQTFIIDSLADTPETTK